MTDDADVLAVVRGAAAEAKLSGVVRVDRDGETILFEAYGLADRRHSTPNSMSTRFGIASGTKGFTALTVMSLVADGVLTLDTTARSLLRDDLPLIDDAVTVGHLLAHRSGIGDYLDESAEYDINDYVMGAPVHEFTDIEPYLHVLDGYPQREPPGEQFRYNNGGFVVLSLLAERAAQEPFRRLVDERVARPAGLTATGFDRGDELAADVATGYLHDGGLRSNVLHLPVRGAGDGGIVTTADDVHRLWRALLDDRIVPSDFRLAMVTPLSDAPDEQMRYGLGFWLHATGDAVMLEGIDAGVSFRTVHDPASDTTHTTLANTSSGAWPVTKALDAALGLD